MNKKSLEQLKRFSISLGEAILIAGIVLFSISPFSCRVTAEGIKILDGDYAPPVIQKVNILDSFTIELMFSEGVSISGCVVSPFIEGVSDSMEASKTEDLCNSIKSASGEFVKIPVTLEYLKENTVVHFVLQEEMEIGRKYELFGSVKDKIGNTLTFLIPFEGYNSKIPKILITEIQSESISSQKVSEKQDGTFRSEFIEFLVLKEGNLSGVEIVSGYDGESKKYSFPPVEVHKGEVFIVHLRNKGAGCISEEGDELNLAFGLYTNPEVRDLWAAETGTSLGNKCDVILVRNKIDGSIMDGVFYVAPETEAWSKDMGAFAQLACDADIYTAASIEEAFVTQGLTASKTIARKGLEELLEKINRGEEIEYPVRNSSEFWEICNEPTPGYL